MTSDDPRRPELEALRQRVRALELAAGLAERDLTRYRLLLEHLNVGVFVSSLDGRMLECNDRTVAMSGERREVLMATNLASYYENPDDRARLLAELRSKGSVRNFETWTRHGDGTRVASSMNAVLAPIGPEGTQLILGMLEDITARKQAEATLSQLSSSLERAARLESLGVLAGGIAHDFNNLLGSLFGHVDLARAHVAEGTAREHLDAAIEAFECAKALTARLLAFAKGGAPVRKHGSLSECVERSAAFALTASNVTLELELEPDLWSVEFDEHQLAQAFGNILTNAQQAMSNGGVLRVAARNIESFTAPAPELSPGRYVKLSFVDDGPGLSPSILGRIFEPFFSTKPGGSGIGLAAAYAILRKHDGLLEAESSPGKGAAFYAWIPAGEVVSAPSARPQPPRKAGKGLVLVMDDDDMVRRVASNMLSHLGYEVIAASDGVEAVEQARSLLGDGKQLRAALLDLTVRSGQGGRETVAPLRTLVPDLAIIASSGYSDDPVMADPERFGFSASLQKPFRISELAELMARFLLS
jgi:two-component system, cell cycle sensor histidine kinase and response regulator CckA